MLIEPVQTARGEEGREEGEREEGRGGEICSIPGMYLVHLCAISCVFGLVASAGGLWGFGIYFDWWRMHVFRKERSGLAFGLSVSGILLNLCYRYI